MKKIMFCGGGSAGHVMPNIAIIRELRGVFLSEYIGTGAIEKQICADEGIKFYQISAPKLIRGKIIANLSVPCRLRESIKEAEKILADEKPCLLFCKGGYASLPPALAAKRLKIPVITHESDLTCGLANKIIAHFAKVTLTSFPETAEKLARGVYCGPPIRKQAIISSRAKAIKKYGSEARKTIIVIGGGSGSKAINDAVRRAAPKLCTEYNIVHLCGRGNAVHTNIEGYRQIEFTEDIGEIYASADCAISRAGSNTAFELIINKIPTLFIPLENGASRGDQVKNALYFKERGLCDILRESELSPENLSKKITELIADKNIKNNLNNYNIKCGNAQISGTIKKIALV